MADKGMFDAGDVEISRELFVLPLRKSVVFPGSLLPIEVGRKQSLVAVERAMAATQLLAVVTQKDDSDDTPGMQLFDVGCAVRILKTMKLAADKVVVIIQGLRRVRVEAVDRIGACFVASVEPIAEPDGAGDELLLRKAATLKETAQRWIAAMPELPPEASALVDGIRDPGQLADVLMSHFDASVEDKQRVLETIPLAQRVDLVLELLQRDPRP